MDAAARQQFKEASIEVTVIRANGDVVNLGTVAYWHRNPLRRLAFRLRRALTRRK